MDDREYRDLLREIRRMLKPLDVRTRNMFVRGVVESAADASGRFAGAGGGAVKVTAFKGEDPIEPVEAPQPYGFLSVPPAGAEAFVLHIGGDPSVPVAIVIDDRRHRPKAGVGEAQDIQPGESVMYVIDGQVVVHGTNDGHVHLGGADESNSPRTDNLVAWAEKVDDYIAAMDALFRTDWVVVASDGGAALKAAFAAAFSVAPDSVACEKTHAG